MGGSFKKRKKPCWVKSKMSTTPENVLQINKYMFLKTIIASKSSPPLGLESWHFAPAKRAGENGEDGGQGAPIHHLISFFQPSEEDSNNWKLPVLNLQTSRRMAQSSTKSIPKASWKRTRPLTWGQELQISRLSKKTKTCKKLRSLGQTFKWLY